LRRAHHRRAIGDVERQRRRLDAERADLAAGALECIRLDVGEHNIDAGLGQGATNAKPDAIRGPGDHCAFALEIAHAPSSAPQS